MVQAPLYLWIYGAILSTFIIIIIIIIIIIDTLLKLRVGGIHHNNIWGCHLNEVNIPAHKISTTEGSFVNF